jgi:hypothetical protein
MNNRPQPDRPRMSSPIHRDDSGAATGHGDRSPRAHEVLTELDESWGQEIAEVPITAGRRPEQRACLPFPPDPVMCRQERDHLVNDMILDASAAAVDVERMPLGTW